MMSPASNRSAYRRAAWSGIPTRARAPTMSPTAPPAAIPASVVTTTSPALTAHPMPGGTDSAGPAISPASPPSSRDRRSSARLGHHILLTAARQDADGVRAEASAMQRRDCTLRVLLRGVALDGCCGLLSLRSMGHHRAPPRLLRGGAAVHSRCLIALRPPQHRPLTVYRQPSHGPQPSPDTVWGVSGPRRGPPMSRSGRPRRGRRSPTSVRSPSSPRCLPEACSSSQAPENRRRRPRPARRRHRSRR